MPTQEIVENITLKMRNELKNEECKDTGNQREIWKDIEGYENSYQISSFGRIKSLNKIINNNFYKEKILNPSCTNNGYVEIGLYKNKKAKTTTIHRLVAKAFIPNPNNLSQVHHKNHIRSDNHIENLEWVDQLQNTRYAQQAGKMLKGERSPLAILTQEQVNKIRAEFIKNNLNYGQMARKYMVSEGCIKHILLNRTWYDESYEIIMNSKEFKQKQIPDRRGTKNSRAILTVEDVIKIRDLYDNQKWSVIKIGILYPHVSNDAIRSVVKRKNWRHI